MKRNIAFFISSNSNQKLLKQSKNSFLCLAKRFNYSYKELRFNIFTIGIIYEDGLVIVQMESSLEFPIGNLGDLDVEKECSFG